jgi:predicted outer membrane repeat protein
VSLTDSTVTSNEGYQGAGIAAPTITLTNSHVDANTGADQGAGLWWCCDGVVTYTITNSTVDNNIGGDQGAGVFHCCSDFNLTITDSSVSGNQGQDQGAGVFFCCGDNDINMTVTRSHIDNNTGTDQGGGFFFCCGGEGNATITVTDSTIDNNTSGDQGGGFFYCCGSAGSDTISIANTSVSGNEAPSDGGGIFICCEAEGGTTTTITGSTIANNTTVRAGEGGGIHTDGAVTIVNSTIHGNTAADNGGGVYCSSGSLNLTNVTITGNTTQIADAGGGIHCEDDEPVNVLNTIVAGNTDPGGPSDCLGTLTSLGNNLLQDTDGCTIVGDTAGNITGVDPALGPLQNNGGLTETRAVQPGTPPYNAGRNAGCPATDQRGVARPQEGTCEIGAYEFQVVTPSPAPGTPTQAPAALPPTGGSQGDSASQAWLIGLAVLGVAAVAGLGTFAVARRRA